MVGSALLQIREKAQGNELFPKVTWVGRGKVFSLFTAQAWLQPQTRFQDLFSSTFHTLLVTTEPEAASGTSQGIDYEQQVNLDVLPLSISMCCLSLASCHLLNCLVKCLDTGWLSKYSLFYKNHQTLYLNLPFTTTQNLWVNGHQGLGCGVGTEKWGETANGYRIYLRGIKCSRITY